MSIPALAIPIRASVVPSKMRGDTARKPSLNAAIARVGLENVEPRSGRAELTADPEFIAGARRAREHAPLKRRAEDGDHQTLERGAG